MTCPSRSFGTPDLIMIAQHEGKKKKKVLSLPQMDSAARALSALEKPSSLQLGSHCLHLHDSRVELNKGITCKSDTFYMTFKSLLKVTSQKLLTITFYVLWCHDMEFTTRCFTVCLMLTRFTTSHNISFTVCLMLTRFSTSHITPSECV